MIDISINSKKFQLRTSTESLVQLFCYIELTYFFFFF